MSTLPYAPSTAAVAQARTAAEELRAAAEQTAATQAALAALLEKASTTGSSGPPGGGYGNSSFAPTVTKWAPDAFDASDRGWHDWAIKFRSFVGAYSRGQVGELLQVVEAHRGDSNSVDDLMKAGYTDPSP